MFPSNITLWAFYALIAAMRASAINLESGPKARTRDARISAKCPAPSVLSQPSTQIPLNSSHFRRRSGSFSGDFNRIKPFLGKSGLCAILRDFAGFCTMDAMRVNVF